MTDRLFHAPKTIKGQLAIVLPKPVKVSGKVKPPRGKV